MPTPALTIADLTQATLAGSGIFDVLMRANKAHLDAEYEKSRIKGTEYATVYLGSLESVMRTALEFLLQKDKQALESQLLEQQIMLAQVEVQKANAELAILQANLTKIPAEIALLNAQTAQVTQQTTNLVAERLLTIEKTANAVLEGKVLIAQECKLKAEYDLTMQSVQKAVQETALLLQKVATERAQTVGAGVDPDSVIGKQKALYQAQTDGFARDAEQKAAKTLIDTWNVRRTTDEATVADGTNMLNDAVIGRAVSKLLTGVGA